MAENIRKLSHAVEQSPVSVLISNVQGGIEYVNRKFTPDDRLYGGRVMGKNPRFLKSGEADDEILDDIGKTVPAKGTWSGDFHLRKKSGELFWVHVDISPLVNESGKITHFVAVKEDITERKRTAEMLRESELRFRQLAETVNDVFWITGPTPGNCCTSVRPTKKFGAGVVRACSQTRSPGWRRFIRRTASA